MKIFLKETLSNFKILILSLCIVFTASSFVNSQNIKITYDELSPQSNYAAEKLNIVLTELGYSNNVNNSEFEIILKVVSDKLGKEAFNILPNPGSILVEGGDGRGLIYGTLSIIEELRNGTYLIDIKKRSESTDLHFRTIKYDLPWDTYRHSVALDLHQETCSDLTYWEAFLDMMAENRFNALTLWNLHPYTFLIKPKNYPEASPWNDEEMKEWKTLFKGIFKLAKERGIDTYLIPFNIFVTKEFALAHNVALHNLEHHHFVAADTSEIIKQYTRECVTQVLQEYPNLTGMGMTLGEGMGGMTPQERENWMKETIIEGMRLAGRKSKLIHRIPFSGNTGSFGETTIEMEKITRKEIEKEAAMDFIEEPVWASMKFNWSHPLSTSKLIKVHGGKLYGSYFEPEPTKYKVIWTARNEDIFCLRWGDPEFIREHIQQNSHSYVGGYFIGSETYIPAKDYFTNPEIEVSWKYAFERQWLFYKIWGRLLYNSETPNEVFENEFIRRYGKDAGKLLSAYSHAGKTPLRLASSFDCTWDFTLYSEGFMALDPDKKRVEYISIDRQINHPPLDTSFISIKDYVTAKLSNQNISKDRTTPLENADFIENSSLKALNIIKDFNISNNNDLMYEVADIETWSNLGLFLSEKLRAGVELQMFRLTGNEQNKKNATAHMEKALIYWDKVIEITSPIYNEMPLVHLMEQDGKSWKENNKLRFHWKFLRKDVLEDLEIIKNSTKISLN